MYRRRYPHTKRLLLVLSLFAATPAGALTSDRDQPINIKADSAEIDNDKGVTVYRGNVVLTRGSIHMTGDTMTVYFDGDVLDTLILEGQPARYQQLPDNSAVPDRAEAMRMEYYELENRIVLIERASFSQEDLSFSADRIEYDTEHSKVIAKSAGDAGDATDKERVNIILKPDAHD